MKWVVQINCSIHQKIWNIFQAFLKLCSLLLLSKYKDTVCLHKLIWTYCSRTFTRLTSSLKHFVVVSAVKACNLLTHTSIVEQCVRFVECKTIWFQTIEKCNSTSLRKTPSKPKKHLPKDSAPAILNVLLPGAQLFFSLVWLHLLESCKLYIL